jgi:hypothetical protein
MICKYDLLNKSKIKNISNYLFIQTKQKKKKQKK